MPTRPTKSVTGGAGRPTRDRVTPTVYPLERQCTPKARGEILTLSHTYGKGEQIKASLLKGQNGEYACRKRECQGGTLVAKTLVRLPDSLVVEWETAGH